MMRLQPYILQSVQEIGHAEQFVEIVESLAI